MKLAVLISSYEQSSSPFREVDIPVDPAYWVEGHQWERFLVDKASAVQQVRELARRGFDAFVCLCDGAKDEDRAGVEVVVELERLGLAYTGADPHFFEPSRLALKLCCPDVGVDTPRYRFAATEADAAAAAEGLRFPLLVKHPNGYGSLGLQAADRVEREADLGPRVAAKIAAFGAALIEEFVEGREFAVLVAEPFAGETEPRTWTPVELTFPPGETFQHFDLKWKDYKRVSSAPLGDGALSERLRHAARRVFQGLGGAGYARIDMRMDAASRIYVLDVNPNPGLFYPSSDPGCMDSILSSSTGGHREFLQHILDRAYARRERLKPRWRLGYRHETGYGIVAARAFEPGERIVILEEAACRYVSRQHVERHWPDWGKKVFGESAVPFTDNVFRIWSARPDEWHPYNHSCEPNAVFEGLDIVAWRPIAEGEPITLEYATFCGPFLTEFTCRCGAPTCRGTIRGTDAFAPWLDQRYGSHLTDYVRTIRARTATGAERAAGIANAGTPPSIPAADPTGRGGPDDLRMSDRIAVRSASGKGRGIFSTALLAAGTVIETCPVLVVPEAERVHLDKTGLYSYYFKWGADRNAAAIALGGGSLYNHSYRPNARYTTRLDERTVEIVALRDIAAEEEITVNYNGEPADPGPLWFEPVL